MTNTDSGEEMSQRLKYMPHYQENQNKYKFCMAYVAYSSQYVEAGDPGARELVSIVILVSSRFE